MFSPKKVSIKKVSILVLIVIVPCIGVALWELRTDSNHIKPPLKANKIDKVPFNLTLSYEDFLKTYDKKIKPPENISKLEELVHSHLKEKKSWEKNQYLMKLVNKFDNVFQFLVVHKDDLKPPDPDGRVRNTITLDGGKSVLVLIDPEKMEVTHMYSA